MQIVSNLIWLHDCIYISCIHFLYPVGIATWNTSSPFGSFQHDNLPLITKSRMSAISSYCTYLNCNYMCDCRARALDKTLSTWSGSCRHIRRSSIILIQPPFKTISINWLSQRKDLGPVVHFHLAERDFWLFASHLYSTTKKCDKSVINGNNLIHAVYPGIR